MVSALGTASHGVCFAVGFAVSTGQKAWYMASVFQSFLRSRRLIHARAQQYLTWHIERCSGRIVASPVLCSFGSAQFHSE